MPLPFINIYHRAPHIHLSKDPKKTTRKEIFGRMSRPAVASSFPATVAIALAVIQLVFVIPAAVVEAHTKTIPADASKLDAWIAHNLKEFNHRKAKDTGVKALDRRLAKAEDNVRLITVRKDGRGNFSTITEAIESIPAGNRRRVVVWIGDGVYREKITIEASKPFVTLYGQKGKRPVITFDGTASEFGTVKSATVAVESDYFVAVNIAFMVRFLLLRFSVLWGKFCK